MFLALTRLLEAHGCPRMDTKQELCPLWTCNQTGDAEGKGTNPHVPAEILQTAGSSRNTRGYIGGQLSYGWESSGDFILERTQTLIFLFPSSLHGDSRAVPQWLRCRADPCCPRCCRFPQHFHGKSSGGNGEKRVAAEQRGLGQLWKCKNTGRSLRAEVTTLTEPGWKGPYR